MLKRALVLLFVGAVSVLGLGQRSNQSFHPQIPKVWEDDAIHDVELPLAAHIPVNHMPSTYYYRIPVRPNPKTYPIYIPGKEPTGYWEWLQQQEPQPAFDMNSLRTEEDWIKAGEVIFEAPKDFTAFSAPFTDVRNPKWYEYTGIRGDKDGIVPFYRYVIREKGKVEINLDSCAECHTRLMPDGTVLKGAQGNVPFGRIWSYRLLNDGLLGSRLRWPLGIAGPIEDHVELPGDGALIASNH